MLSDFVFFFKVLNWQNKILANLCQPAYFFFPFWFYWTLPLEGQECLMYVYPLSLPLDDTRYSVVPDYFLNVSLVSPASCFLSPSRCVALRHAVSNQYLVIWLLSPKKKNKKISRCKHKGSSRQGSPRFSILSQGETRPLQTAVSPLWLLWKGSQLSITIVLTGESKMCLEFKITHCLSFLQQPH